MGSLCLIFRTRNKSPELDHNHDHLSVVNLKYTGINFAGERRRQELIQ